MVVHSPDKFEVQRAAAAAAAATAAATGGAATPPSVTAAGSAAVAGDAVATPASGAAGGVDEDLLGDSTTVHDFAALQLQAEVHAGTDGREDDNVTLRRGRRYDGFTHKDDEDKISLAGSIADAAPPPQTSSNPQLNPFTPEWFAKIIGAAASSAATAAVAAATRAQAPPPPPAAPNPSVPRRLNDRKVPDFWEDRPEFWFQIFDAHLFHFRPISEKQCFDALLPLLTPAARSTVHSVIRTQGGSPYSKARDALLRHFGKTPRQLAREAREARSLGDKLPSEFLDHVMALMPDVRTFYEIALLDALPSNARVAALQHSSVEAMARAADAVVLESRAEAESPRSVSAVASPLLDDDVFHPGPPPLTPTSAAVAAVSRSSTPAPAKKELCSTHARWGKKAFKCLAPSTCKMRNITIPRPSPSAAASGNGRAGGQ